jgi:hypothetical protein
MSPKVATIKNLVFYFHSYDVQHEERASVHVGMGSQNDVGDAKIWLEPSVEICRRGRVLEGKELNDAVKSIKKNHKDFIKAWQAHKQQAR